MFISNKSSGCSYLNNKIVRPKGPKAGGAIIGCFALAIFTAFSLGGYSKIVLEYLPYNAGIGISQGAFTGILASLCFIMAYSIILLHTELRHKAGFNIPDRFLDGPVEAGDEELANLPPI